MSEWKETKLGDLIIIKSGFSYKGEFIGKGDSFLLGMGCVSFNKRFLNSGARKYSGTFSDSFTAKPGDIVLATRQQSDNLPILGLPAILPDEFKGKKVVVGTNLYRVENHSEISNDFLFWLLKSPEYQHHILASAKGTTVKMITKDAVESFRFNCPPEEVRNFISQTLSIIEDKIELNNKINQELESLAQLLFKRWFVDFEFPNENGEPYKSSGGEMVDSEIGEIPKGWQIGALSSIATLDKSNVKPFEFPNKEFNHFSLPDYDNGKKPSLSIGSDILSSKYKVSPNSILVSKLNPRIPRVWVITDCEDNCICSTEFQVVRPKSLHYFTFLCNLCSSEKFFDSLKSKVTGTSSSHQRVNPNDIINYIMPLPSIEIVREFSMIFNENFKLINKNIQENNSLSQIRDTLLPKLISGELQINDN